MTDIVAKIPKHSGKVTTSSENPGSSTSVDSDSWLDDDSGTIENQENTNVLDCDIEEIKKTPNEYSHAIKAYDCTVEIIGYVDAIEASRLVGAKNIKLFEFYLNNGAGDRVQIVAWRSEMDRCEIVVKPNSTVHIDGAYAKPSADGNFNKGTINYKLIIQSSTILNTFGYHSITETTFVPELIVLKNIGRTTNNCVRLQGFVKTNFGVIVKQTTNGGNNFGSGSITDGEFKIEVRIPQLKNILHEIEKGDHIEVNGEIQMNANPIYILCKSINDIKGIDRNKMTLKKLLKGYKTIQKEKTTEADKRPIKKKK